MNRWDILEGDKKAVIISSGNLSKLSLVAFYKKVLQKFVLQKQELKKLTIFILLQIFF